jgi:hypothetical protein
MARKKYEFRQDKTGPDLLSKLYLTKKQRSALLKWTLFALVLLVLSLIQDVILCHVNIFGASTDLLPFAILLACTLLGADSCCVFSLVAAAFYQFSGTGPGYYTIALIPVLGTVTALIRQAYLQSEWIGPSQGQLDPTKEVAAAISAIENGLSTREAEAIRLNGSEYAANVDKLTLENERLRKANGMASQTFDASQAESQEEQSAEDEEPKEENEEKNEEEKE